MLLTTFLAAQEVTLKAYAPNLVEVGERFQLTYSANKRPKNFNLPSIKGFEILAGPSTSSSTSIEMINGRVTQKQTYSYTYILQAVKEGTFTIPPAEARIGNKIIRSNPLRIEVVDAGEDNQQNGNIATRHAGSSGAGKESLSGELASGNLFVAVRANKHSAVVGEPIEVTIKVYTRVNIVGFENAKFPAFDGFWSQELETNTNIFFKQEKVNGKIYNVGIIRRYLLYPQKADKLTISPFEMDVIYQAAANRPRSLFDEFFGGGVETYRKRVLSKPVTIEVKKLPENAPKSFNGAVGSYKIALSVDKHTLKANEAVTFKLKVTGKGNIKLMGTPAVEFPSTFEVFDPKVSDNISLKSIGSYGSKTFEYVAIPRTPGKYRINPVAFTYYDLAKKRYVTLHSKPVDLNVTADSSSASGVVVTGYSKEDIKFIGKDIRFIKSSAKRFYPLNTFVVASGLYHLAYVVALLLFIIFLYGYRKHLQLASDAGLMRQRKADRMAKKRLIKAKQLLQQNSSEQFYQEVHRALWGYLSDKLAIPPADLNIEEVVERLSEKNIEQADIELLTGIVDRCEYARFSPDNNHSQMDTLYNDTLALISAIENKIGKVKAKLW